MVSSALARKLQVKPGQRLVVVNPPPGYLETLQPLPEGATLAEEPAGTFDCVQLFVSSVAELERLAPTALAAARRDGLLWIAYPKQSSKVKTDLTRDVGWESVRSAGWRPVSQIAVDEVWSALRFRPVELVGK